MFKIFKGYFAAGFGTIVGMFTGAAVVGYISTKLNGNKIDEETDPDIETEE